MYYLEHREHSGFGLSEQMACLQPLEKRNTTDVELVQDISGPPAQEHANLLCNVALYMHVNRPLHCKPLAIQPLRSRTTTVFANDSSMQLLCRLPHSRKFEFGI
jgi:hypothetical protein